VKKSETDIVEFEALALVHGPTRMNQVNKRRGSVITDMIRLFPCLCRNLSLAASLRTSIPEYRGFVKKDNVIKEAPYIGSFQIRWVPLGRSRKVT